MYENGMDGPLPAACRGARAAFERGVKINGHKKRVPRRGVSHLHRMAGAGVYVEHETDDDCMLFISERLSLPQSTFSKAVKALCAAGLVDKYHMLSNRKNIILKPTKRGAEVYEVRARMLYEKTFKAFFEALESVDDDTLAVVAEAIGVLNGRVGKPLDHEVKDRLVKIE